MAADTISLPAAAPALFPLLFRFIHCSEHPDPGIKFFSDRYRLLKPVKLIQISNFTHVQLPFAKTELNTPGASNSKQSAVRGRNSVLKLQLPVQKKADHFSFDWKALNHPWPGDVLSNPDSAAV